MSDLAKMEMPNFIKTKCIMSFKEDGSMRKIDCRINPLHITSYYYSFYNDGGDKKDATAMYIGGVYYLIDMTVSEVDEMIESIDRGMSIKE